MKRIKTFLTIIIILLIPIILVLLFLAITEKFQESFIEELIISGIIEFVVFLVRIFIDKITILITRILRKKYNYKKEYNNEHIRLSFAYLIRIRVNNKYLLVKSLKRNVFQPVGGVYYIYEKDYIKEKLGFFRDNYPGDDDDIRGKIKGKKIKKFIKWFNKKVDRETNPSREFNEEMINSGILPKNIFSDLNFQYINHYYKGIGWNEYYSINELLRFDIYELILNKAQLDFLLKLKNKKIYFATSEEIKTLGVTKDNDKRLFGTQTPYILEEGVKNE